jgi:hypothetical protein
MFIDILCMPIATTQNNMSGDSNYRKYFDHIICKWQSSGKDYCDNSAIANSDCQLIGYSSLWDTQYLTNNNFDDQIMLKHYINASNCNR